MDWPEKLAFIRLPVALGLAPPPLEGFLLNIFFLEINVRRLTAFAAVNYIVF